MTTRPSHAPDVGFIARGATLALCSCGALQIVDPAYARAPRPWLRKNGWSRPPTNLADPNDGWFCPACTAQPACTALAAIVTEERHVELLEARLAEVETERDRLSREVERLRAERDGEVWLWNGDGFDDPESLSCPVLMTADQVRALTDEVERLRDAEGER